MPSADTATGESDRAALFSLSAIEVAIGVSRKEPE
jgi:hypothetical protein